MLMLSRSRARSEHIRWWLCRASHQVPDMPANKWQRGTTKAQAANALSGGALTQRPHPPPSEFQIEVVALDVGLHFVEVESPDSEEDKVHRRAPCWHTFNVVHMMACHVEIVVERQCWGLRVNVGTICASIQSD